MNFDIVVVCSAVVGASFLLFPLKEFKVNYYAVAVISLCVLVAITSLKAAMPLLGYINSFFDSDYSLYFKTLIKILGISLMCNITVDTVTELGMNSLAGKVQFAGKIAILLSAIPIFDRLFSQIEVFI